MSTEIVKQFTELQLQKLKEEFSTIKSTYQVGDIFFDGSYSNATYIRISKITAEKAFEWVGRKKKYLKDQFDFTIHFDKSRDWECTVWSSYGSKELNQFHKEYGSGRVTRPLREIFKEALEVINGERSIEDYKEKNISSDEQDTSLMHIGSKESLTAIKEDLEKQVNNVEMIKGAVKFEMEKRKQALDKIKDSLGLVLKDFKKKIAKIEKVIYTIELYLGIKEDIVQIQEGTKADVTEPIFFRQEVLFMDEEVGDPEDDGIDFKKIGDFDNWLTRNNNYKKVLPETKGIVAIRVRREDKKYCDNPYINAMMNLENKETYILIRNGDELYRIWGDIIIYPRLFPRKSELQDLKDRWDSIKEKQGTDGGSYVYIPTKEGDEEHVNAKEALEKVDNEVFRYKQQFILLQGLLDRTEVFNPVPERIKLMDEQTQERGLVRFIYDDETKLPDSRIPFKEWKDSINQQIQVGSRIFITAGEADSDRLDGRFVKDDKYSSNPKIEAGIYTVYGFTTDRQRPVMVANPNYNLDDMDKKSIFNTKNFSSDLKEFKDGDNYYSKKTKQREHPMTEKRDNEGRKIYEPYKEYNLCIRFNPKDKVQNWWDRWDDGHERKNRLRYEIKISDDDILNYDLMSFEDVDFYLTSRPNRRHYLKMMPVLNEIKKARLKEIEWEKHFVQMMLGEVGNTPEMEEKIWEAISWWKTKNKWKRPIRQDDAKALRMIKARIEKETNE